MVRIGEESGKLEEALDEITSLYEEETEQLLKFSISLLEPLLILFIGVVIGFIVISMLLPIFNLGGGI